MKTAIERAIEIVGNQSALARVLGVKPQAVQQWVTTGRVPAKRVIPIENATGKRVTRHELSPDLYPEPDPVRRQNDSGATDRNQASQ